MIKVEHISDSWLPLAAGKLKISVFRDAEGLEHAILQTETLSTHPLVRLHSECLTGDVFASKRCDCGPQLQTAIQMIATSGNGLIIYLRGHEGRGIGLGNKIKAYALQDQGADTVEANHQLGFSADERGYEAAIGILNLLNIKELRLLSNNPSKLNALEKAGIVINERVPLWLASNPNNANYLETKKKKLGHIA